MSDDKKKRFTQAIIDAEKTFDASSKEDQSKFVFRETFDQACAAAGMTSEDVRTVRAFLRPKKPYRAPAMS